MQNGKIKNDGRRLRSLNTQNAIVDALMNLVQRGILEPTAQQVSDEADLGIRTVFRQIQDKETLFILMDERVKQNYAGDMMNTTPCGDIKSRIKELVVMEARTYESNLQFLRATLANKWKYKTLQKNYKRNQKNLKALLYSWLPEVKEETKATQAFLTSINSTGYWIELRENQQLSVEDACALKIQAFENTLL